MEGQSRRGGEGVGGDGDTKWAVEREGGGDGKTTEKGKE